MKPSRPIVLLLSAVWLLTLAACGPTAFRTRLAGADSLLSLHPDSALHVLRGWEAEAGRARKSDRMYWRLLLADAENKCYVDQTSDSAMKAVADYYDSHGTANDQVRAHYLLGCAYRDMSDAPQALQCYQDAVDRADTTSKDCDYRLLMAVYGQMADLYCAQLLPLDELKADSMYIKYAIQARDTFNYLRNYELMIRPYFLLCDTLKVEEILENVRHLYRESNYNHEAARTYLTNIHLCTLRGQLEEARDLIHIYETESGLFDENGNIQKDREGYYYYKGNYFLETGQNDSAEYYYRKLLANSSKKDKAGKGLMKLYLAKNRPDSVEKYALFYEDAYDSLNAMNRTATIHQMSKLYNYQHYLRQANEEREAADHAKMLLAMIVAVFVLFAVIAFVTFYIYRNRKEAEKASIKQNYEQKLIDYNKAISDLDKLKCQDIQFLEEKEMERNALQEQLENSRHELLQLRSKERLGEFLDSDIVGIFKQKSEMKRGVTIPSNSDWRRLIDDFSQYLPLTFSIIGHERVLSPQELRVCILTLLGFKTGDIRVLLDVENTQYVTTLKARVNKKLFAVEKASELEKNLRNLHSNG